MREGERGAAGHRPKTWRAQAVYQFFSTACRRRSTCASMWGGDDDAQSLKERLQREIAKRRARGEPLVPLAAPAGSKKLTTTFWGQAWCRNLEAYQQYESRLPRGRSYLRQGKVHDLKIEPGGVSAVVVGQELYETEIQIDALSQEQWQRVLAASQGQVSSMLDLLAGKLGEGVMAILTDQDQGLFPKPAEIHFNCSCPDFADICKHASAVLYGVGVMLDTQPELLFTLRKVDQAELLAAASQSTLAGLGDGLGHSLGDADLSALFGIELGEAKE